MYMSTTDQHDKEEFDALVQYLAETMKRDELLDFIEEQGTVIIDVATFKHGYDRMRSRARRNIKAAYEAIKLQENENV